MKFKKILSGMLAVMMTVTAASLTVSADESAAGGDELVLHYSKIQKGNVDHKDRAVIDPAFKDADKGEVVKVAPIVDTVEKGAVMVDGYGIAGLQIDVTKFNYLTVEYKYVSKLDADIRAYVRFLPNGGVLKKDAGIESNETLKTNEWSTLTFNFGSQVKPLVADGKQFIGQLHFYPFGQQLTPSSFRDGDHILIRNWTFSVDNPNGDVYYDITFESGDKDATGTAPAPVKARYDDEITLPEIPFTCEGSTAGGWIMDAGMTVYQPGETFKMSSEKDIRFSVIWEEEFVAQSVIELPMQKYINGICDHRDTATLDMGATHEGYSVVEVIPNLAGENATRSINLDGWSYTGANIHAEGYKTIVILYKYVSDNPVTGKANLNIMRSGIFSKETNMTSREDIVANRWAVASFDLTAALPNIKEGLDPIIKQLHYYPLGNTPVASLSADDRIYVAKMFALPGESTAASVHEAFMNGYADGTFGVSGNMTRAEACTIVARLVAGGDANVPADKTTAFTDVPADQWYHKYVSYVESLGYLGSYSGAFLPNQAITRAEFVELVYNMGLLADNGKNGTFTDVPADHPKAAVVAAAGKAGLVNGYANGDGTFSFKPDATITRAEVVKVINNAYGKAPSVEGMFETAKGKFTDVTPDHWAYADILDAATGHISYMVDGKEAWFSLSGANAVSEDFNPDYETGKAKLDEALDTMEKRIAEIRGTESAKFDIKGTTYYVSASTGDDSNDGKSEAKPFKTATKAKTVAKYGDLVLFKRGDMWRERWAANTGVTYSAYGTGEKPIFNGNVLGDAADASLWTLVPGTNNIWKYAKGIADVGNIILNDGAKGTIEKVVPKIADGQLLVDGKPFDPATSLTKDLHFISTYQTIDPNNPSIKDATGTLYVRCDAGNPGSVYDSIELAYYGTLISVPSDVTMDNIHIRYTGSHGFGMGTVNNVKFTNLEVGYIGGTSQYYKNGNMTRFGNGIEVYGGCNNFVIDNCYVYQCYDAGITNQISTGGTNDVIEQNVKFINNVIDKCIYNIEYFMGKGDTENVVRLLKDIEYSGNILARSGYGWGMSPQRSASIKGWDHFNRSENFKIMNNTFILDRINACDLGASLKTWLPEFSGNTYIQKYGNTFTRVSAQYNFTGKATESLDTIGETDYKVFYVPADIEIG